MKVIRIFLYNIFLLTLTSIWAQNVPIEQFNFQKKIESGPVLNQFRSNTCWSYTLLGMIETEILSRTGKSITLSEMFLVYYAYLEKAERYIRMHGKIAFSEGGMLTDPLYLIEKYGIVPLDIYSGMLPGETLPDHTQLESNLKNYLDELLLKKYIPINWKKRFQEILELHMGKVPEQFEYEGVTYTPKSYAQSLNIKSDDYALLMSFDYLPYYRYAFVEVPDNWNLTYAFNIPIEELILLIDYSLQKSFPVAITCDITEKGFLWNKGLAFAFESDIEREKLLESIYRGELPSIQEIKVDTKIRQMAFDTYETTDDHSLVILGVANDKNGRKYYYAKNSWGVNNNPYQGYLFLSESYMKYKIITLLIRKQLLPLSLMQRMQSNR
ncbi:MAG: aminopeptidase [Bacteroidales bacterium]|nr:aminopeptidase [Bacteroidales bacterium]